MVHALVLLLVVLVAAPLAGDVRWPALAAILMFVAWNMGEWREFVHLRKYRVPYRVTCWRCSADGGARPDGGGRSGPDRGLRHLHLPHLQPVAAKP
jgi:hypothetical protein